MDIVGITTATSNAYKTDVIDDGSMAKDDFLQLMIAQMKYQDPLEPMSNTDMSSQLAQFSSLESLNNIYDTMTDNVLLTQSLNNSYMTSLIGKNVKAYGNTVDYQGEKTEISYNLSATSNVTVNVYDEDGDLVTTINPYNQRAGDNTITWDGTDSNGEQVDNGIYTFEVVATDSEGNTVTADGYVNGYIEGITYESGSPFLVVHGTSLGLGAVISILDGE